MSRGLSPGHGRKRRSPSGTHAFPHCDSEQCIRSSNLRYIRPVATAAHSFDVLVVGSGAAGLAAAVSADRAGARVAIATKGSLQANNSSKAQGGIQAAFAADDSPEQHAQDVWTSSHETA